MLKFFFSSEEIEILHELMHLKLMETGWVQEEAEACEDWETVGECRQLTKTLEKMYRKFGLDPLYPD